MTPRPPRILFWLPRVLGILFALFLSLFAFDVFGEGVSFGEALPGFLVHLTPTYLVLIAVAVGWRRPLLGGVLFIALVLLYVVVFRGELYGYVFIGGPLLLIALLFLLDWRTSKPLPIQP